MKNCSKCDIDKPIKMFYKNKVYKDGLNPFCRLCARHLRRQRKALKKGNHFMVNPDIYKNHINEKKAITLSRNNVQHAKRRASKLNATVSWSNKNLIKQFYEAAQILKEITGIIYEVDHIIPLQGKNVCGLHVETNLQLLEQSDNRIKSNKLIM